MKKKPARQIVPCVAVPVPAVVIEASLAIIAVPRIDPASIARSRSISESPSRNYRKGWDAAFGPKKATAS